MTRRLTQPATPHAQGRRLAETDDVTLHEQTTGLRHRVSRPVAGSDRLAPRRPALQARPAAGRRVGSAAAAGLLRAVGRPQPTLAFRDRRQPGPARCDQTVLLD